MTHVKGFKVCVDLGDELLAVVVVGWQPHVWHVGLGEGEEDKSATGGPTQQTRAKIKIRVSPTFKDVL